jgi:hypothetical protein
VTTISALPVSFGLQWTDVTPDARLAICMAIDANKFSAPFMLYYPPRAIIVWLASCLSTRVR